MWVEVRHSLLEEDDDPPHPLDDAPPTDPAIEGGQGAHPPACPSVGASKPESGSSSTPGSWLRSSLLLSELPEYSPLLSLQVEYPIPFAEIRWDPSINLMVAYLSCFAQQIAGGQ